MTLGDGPKMLPIGVKGLRKKNSLETPKNESETWIPQLLPSVWITVIQSYFAPPATIQNESQIIIEALPQNFKWILSKMTTWMTVCLHFPLIINKII